MFSRIWSTEAASASSPSSVSRWEDSRANSGSRSIRASTMEENVAPSNCSSNSIAAARVEASGFSTVGPPPGAGLQRDDVLQFQEPQRLAQGAPVPPGSPRA